MKPSLSQEVSSHSWKVFKRGSHSFVLGALLAFLSCVGCGSGGTGASLSGPVTLDGQPIASGNLQFMPATGEGQPVSAEVKDGKYSATDVPLGKVKVMVQAFKQVGEMDDGSGRKYPKLEPIVPPQYRDGIEIDVSAGSKEVPIVMTSGK